MYVWLDGEERVRRIRMLTASRLKDSGRRERPLLFPNPHCDAIRLMSFLQRRAAPLLRPTTASLRCKRPISSLSAALKEHAPIDVHPEVQEALARGRPVVALETTIVTHGMPYPTNRETALSVEGNVRKAGAVPATIGLIEGRVKIGLEPHELERLANVGKNPSVVKLSRRDLGAAIALKKDGVSAHVLLGGVGIVNASVMTRGQHAALPLSLLHWLGSR